MAKKGTTVDECCPKSCVFRCPLDGGTHYCNYIGITGTSRGCEVKDCDKAATGTRKVKQWTNITDECYEGYEVTINGKREAIKRVPKQKRKDRQLGKTSTYGEEQMKKTLAQIPKIKTTL